LPRSPHPRVTAIPLREDNTPPLLKRVVHFVTLWDVLALGEMPTMGSLPSPHHERVTDHFTKQPSHYT
jgi:hypothetical protein